MDRKKLPEINAGSMADIAFLLLIFFLVTTTLNAEFGILRKIPQKQKTPTTIDIKEKNFLEVNINMKNELFVEDKIIAISDLKDIAIQFLDNGGGFDKDGNACTWCNGDKNPKLSDHPSKAVIKISTDRKTNYETYITVLNEINAAYNNLRNKVAIKMYGVNLHTLEQNYKTNKKDRTTILEKIKTVKEKYPLLLSDLDTNQDMAKR